MAIHIYGGALSPFVMRPVLAARAKGLDISPEPFEGGIKSDAYRALTPMAILPCPKARSSPIISMRRCRVRR